MKKKIISLLAAAAMLASMPAAVMADGDAETLLSYDFEGFENAVEYYHEGALDYGNKVLADGTLGVEKYEDMDGMTLYTTSREGGDDSSYWQLTKDANGGQALTTQVSRFSSSGRGAKIEFKDTYAPDADKAVVLKFDAKVENAGETKYDPSIQINGDGAYQIDFISGLKMELGKWETVTVYFKADGTSVFVGESESAALKMSGTSLASITFNGMIEGIDAGEAIKAESNPLGYPAISIDNMEISTIALNGDEEASAEENAENAPDAEEGVSVSESPAVDVKPEFKNVSDWAKDTVETAVEMGLIPVEMYSDDLTNNITREEFAAVAVKLFESIKGTPAPEARIVAFGDIENSGYASYITKAYVLNIVNGTSPTEFSPKATITREQMATMLTRAVKAAIYEDWSLENDFNFPKNGPKVFDDDAQISEYAKNSVYYMADNDIIKGMDETHFAPLNTATKEQAIAIAQRTNNMLNTDGEGDAE